MLVFPILVFLGYEVYFTISQFPASVNRAVEVLPRVVLGRHECHAGAERRK